MSLAQELTKTQAQLEAAQVKAEAQKARIAELEAELGVALESAQAATDAQAQLQGQIDNHETAMQEQAQAHEDATAELRGQVETLTAENATMREQLANPGFRQAAGGGEEPDTAGGGGEAGIGGIPHWDAYNAIKDPAERTAYYNAHSAEMLAEQRAAAGR